MNPHDPDPLTVDWTDTAVEWWDEGYRRGRKARRVDLAVIVLAAFALGCAATILAYRVSATPRSAQHSALPVVVAERTGAPLVGAREASEALTPRAAAWSEPFPATLGSGAPHPISGTASWYPARGFIAAAGPGLRTGHWRGKIVETCLSKAPRRCITVKLADWCQCYGTRLLDLSDDAFARLAPLSRGLVHVTVTSAGPAPTPPMTDSVP